MPETLFFRMMKIRLALTFPLTRSQAKRPFGADCTDMRVWLNYSPFSPKSKGRKWEDEHWHNLKTQKHGFTVVVSDKFGKTKKWLIAEIRFEPTITYTTQEAGPDVESRTEDTIFLRGNSNAFIWLAGIISGFLSTSPPAELSCQIDTSQFSEKDGLKIKFAFDPLFV